MAVPDIVEEDLLPWLDPAEPGSEAFEDILARGLRVPQDLDVIFAIAQRAGQKFVNAFRIGSRGIRKRKGKRGILVDVDANDQGTIGQGRRGKAQEREGGSGQQSSHDQSPREVKMLAIPMAIVCPETALRSKAGSSTAASGLES